MHPGWTITGEFLADLRAMRRDWLLKRRSRQARVQLHPQQRHIDYCRTMSDGTYPTEGSGAKVFSFVFVEATFTETEGATSVTITDLATAAQGVGATIDAAYVPDDTLCEVVRQRNGRYILKPLECG